jgi:V/A-type H+/Na+-transporting ATPase subunit D
MELLERKAQVALARRGRDLLERKRAALVVESSRLQERVRQQQSGLRASWARAGEALALAEALAGPEAVQAAALHALGAELELATVSVTGVRVTALRRSPPSEPPGPVPGHSPAVDAAGSAFAGTVDAAIRLAEAQEQLAAVAAEAKRLSRRVNALDTLLIPRLEAERDHIESALDERERAARFQLKLVQRRLATGPGP